MQGLEIGEMLLCFLSMFRYCYLGYLDTSGYRLEDDLEVINHLIDADLQDITKLETELFEYNFL